MFSLHMMVAASDLHAKRPPNSMMKYADDSYLLLGSRQISTVTEEFAHIKAWAASNNLQLNPLKTRELIVYRPGPHPPGCNQGYLYAGPWCNHLLQPYHGLPPGRDPLPSSGLSASSTHALRTLRSHGLGSPQLYEVAQSTTLASMLYASPAWWGFTTAQDRDRLGRLMGWLRGGFLPAQDRSFGDLAAEADRKP